MLSSTVTHNTTSGATLPFTLPLTATQANTSEATLPFTFPLMASQANTSGTMQSGTIPPIASQVQPVDLQLIAQQAAQMAAEQAVARVLTSPSQPQDLLPLPAALHNFSQPASHLPSLSHRAYHCYQSLPATRSNNWDHILSTSNPGNMCSSSHPTWTFQPHLTPLSVIIPTIPAKFVTAEAAGEFVELLHAIEVDSRGGASLMCTSVRDQGPTQEAKEKSGK